MKFQVDRDVFTETVAWTARSLPSRPAAPVLAGLLFEAVMDHGADPGTVRVSGFDYDTSSCAEISAEVIEPGRVLVHGKLLADIAKSLPSRSIRGSWPTACRRSTRNTHNCRSPCRASRRYSCRANPWKPRLARTFAI